MLTTIEFIEILEKAHRSHSDLLIQAQMGRKAVLSWETIPEILLMMKHR